MTESLEERFARLEERLEGMREGVRVAKTEVDRRLEEMNELRRQIERERGAYVDTTRYEERHEELVRRLSSLENVVAGLSAGSEFKSSTVTWLIAGMGVLITVVVIVVNVLTS